MTALLVILFVMIAASGTGVVLTRKPRHQVFAIGINGLVMTLLFMALQAPDVAYSELTVGTALLPALFFITLTSIKQDRAMSATRSGDASNKAPTKSGDPTHDKGEAPGLRS